jgi:hypothetical protein
MQRKHDPVF